MRYTDFFEVGYHDIDTGNEVKPSNLIRFMQETANHQLRDRHPTYFELLDEGRAFVLTRITVEIYAPLRLYDDLAVSTWRCPGKSATFLRCFQIRRDGVVTANAYSVWAMVHIGDGSLCKTREVDLSEYETDTPLELQLPTRFRLPKDVTFAQAGVREVFYSDLDMNHHMNNTYYPDMLWNFIPEIQEKEVTSLNLRFMAEAPLGAKLEVYRGRRACPAPEDPRAEETWCFYSKVGTEINVEAEIGVRRRDG